MHRDGLRGTDSCAHGFGRRFAGTACFRPSRPALNENRIFGVIPDYQTVTDSTGPVKPLTPKQKWTLALKESVDPFNVLNAAMGAAFSQRGNQTPKYGEGDVAYARRFGAALADFSTQNFFSAGLLATVLHQDPRYYRKGPGTGVPKRVVYSVSRLVIARQDSGANAFNASGIGGMMLGIAASNLYYPAVSVRGSVMACRVSTSLTGGIMGNLMSEFWPDIQKRFFHKNIPIRHPENNSRGLPLAAAAYSRAFASDQEEAGLLRVRRKLGGGRNAGPNSGELGLQRHPQEAEAPALGESAFQKGGSVFVPGERMQNARPVCGRAKGAAGRPCYRKDTCRRKRASHGRRRRRLGPVERGRWRRLRRLPGPRRRRDGRLPRRRGPTSRLPRPCPAPAGSRNESGCFPPAR